jgi:6-phosphogluconolactonase
MLPHGFIFAPEPYAFVPDLGKDIMVVYEFDKKAKSPLIPRNNLAVSSKPGAGPRHCVFHPSGQFCYLINELDSTMSALKYNESNGSFELLQTVSSLPEGVEVANTCADVQITPDGKFVYGSNRGHDSVIIYSIDSNTGTLTYVGCESTGGRTPRNFAIDPTGTFLLAGNQDTDNIVVFRINSNTGKLKKVTEVEVPTPVCIKPFFFHS